MSSILIVSPDPQSASTLQALAQESGFRARIVTNAATAIEWLSMSQFRFMLIDADYGERVALQLLNRGWQYNELMLTAVFDLYKEVPYEWDVALLGGLVFAGTDAVEKIRTGLENLHFEEPSTTEFPILLVEDLDSPREIIQDYIEVLGFEKVEGVASGAEALKRLDAHPGSYACIVTDMNMPEMDGAELIRQIRRDERFNRLPVIVLTAYSTAENLIECIRAGATGFLVKPPRKKALLKELDRARRVYFSRQSPRLCRAEDAHLLEQALLKSGS